MIRTQTTVKHVYFFFFNDTATTEIYTLSLHDALPIYFSMLSPHRGPEECGRANPLLRDSAAIRVLLSLYSRVLPVGAAEGVVCEVLEVWLPHAGEHREVHGDRCGLLDQDLLRLQHVLHAQLQV